MALVDYYNPDHETEDPELFFDDVEALGIIPGTPNSGRSDEYLGYEEEKDTSYGHLDWYLFLRDDDHEDERLNTFANIDLEIAINTSPSTTIESIEEAYQVADKSSIGYAYLGHNAGNGYIDGYPNESDMDALEEVRFDMTGAGGDEINFSSVDDMWDPQKYSDAMAKQVKWGVAEAERLAKELQGILNPQ